jgi:hypothetical protein
LHHNDIESARLNCRGDISGSQICKIKPNARQNAKASNPQGHQTTEETSQDDKSARSIRKVADRTAKTTPQKDRTAKETPPHDLTAKDTSQKDGTEKKNSILKLPTKE